MNVNLYKIKIKITYISSNAGIKFLMFIFNKRMINNATINLLCKSWKLHTTRIIYEIPFYFSDRELKEKELKYMIVKEINHKIMKMLLIITMSFCNFLTLVTIL